MSTVFETYAGQTREPIQVDVITPQGVKVGHIGDYESVRFTTSITAADTLELEMPLGELSALLAPCDGSVLVQYTINDQVFLFMPAQVEAHSLNGAPEVGYMSITCAGGWTFLDRELVPPSLFDPIDFARSTSFSIEGNLESVVKQVALVGSQRANHPIYVLTSQDRGPFVHVSGGWDTAAELIRKVMPGTGFYLDLRGWVSGFPYPEFEPFAPTMFLDVKPFRDTDIHWSAEAGDLVRWTLTHKRAQATRVTLGYETKSPANRKYVQKTDGNHSPAWYHRELYSEFRYAYENWEDKEVPPDPYRLHMAMEKAALTELAKNGPTASVSAEVDVANLWAFSADTTNPRAFNTGDRVALDLPGGLGSHQAVITSVEVETTADSHKVTPVVSSPDIMDPDVFSRVAGLANQVHHLEQKG